MSEAILGHPFSGALYGYFADQLQGDHSHTQSSSSYYKTLYGANYEAYAELALNFLLLYRHVWVTLADNPLPTTPLISEDRSEIPELGLHMGYYDQSRDGLSYAEHRANLTRLAADPKVGELLGRILKIPRHAWELILDSAVYEAALSAHKRLPLLCSRGRRVLIRRLVEIDRPSLHPLMPELHHVQFIESYRELTGLALRPKNLDDLVAIKLDPAVRQYGDGLLQIAHTEGSHNSSVSVTRVAELVREAMHTESVGRRISGLLNWTGKFSRIAHEPILTIASAVASKAVNYDVDRAGWYEFTGSIDHAIDKYQLQRRVEFLLGASAEYG